MVNACNFRAAIDFLRKADYNIYENILYENIQEVPAKMKLQKLAALLVALAILILPCAVAETSSEADWWNILLLGTDNRSEEHHGRTDSMIILSVNQATGQAKLTSILRDTWVKIEGHGSNKLNAACVFGGPELTMQTINEHFGADLSDYVMVNISGLAEIIDLLGGVDLDVTEAERKALNKGLFELSSLSGMEKLEESGENVHLNGNQAVAFARIRKIDSDSRRAGRQRTLLTEIAHKLSANDSVTIIGVINKLMPYVKTNISLPDLVALAAVGLKMDLSSIQQFRLPADKTFKSGMFGNVWCIKPDFEKNAELLHDFIYNDDSTVAEMNRENRE